MMFADLPGVLQIRAEQARCVGQQMTAWLLGSNSVSVDGSNTFSFQVGVNGCALHCHCRLVAPHRACLPVATGSVQLGLVANVPLWGLLQVYGAIYLSTCADYLTTSADC